MILLISFVGLLICLIAMIYLIGQKRGKKKTTASINTTLELLPERKYDDGLEAFEMSEEKCGFAYMDLVQIKAKDLVNTSDDEIYFDMAKFTRFYKKYATDIKLVAMNFPSDMSRQIKYYRKKRDKNKNTSHRQWIDTKIAQFEWIEKNQTTREYYFMVFAENQDKLVRYRELMSGDLGFGRDGLLLEIDREKKIEILGKLNNKNMMISKRIAHEEG